MSFVSYFYFLLYELFSPYIEVMGVLTTILAFAVDLINIPFMIVFLGIYVAYTALLSLTAFFARLHTVDLKLHSRMCSRRWGCAPSRYPYCGSFSHRCGWRP